MLLPTVFKQLKALRPLKMLKAAQLKDTLESMVISLPSLKNAIFIDLILLYVFGILGVQLLNGRLGECSDEQYTTREACLAAS